MRDQLFVREGLDLLAEPRDVPVEGFCYAGQPFLLFLLGHGPILTHGLAVAESRDMAGSEVSEAAPSVTIAVFREPL